MISPDYVTVLMVGYSIHNQIHWWSNPRNDSELILRVLFHHLDFNQDYISEEKSGVNFPPTAYFCWSIMHKKEMFKVYLSKSYFINFKDNNCESKGGPLSLINNNVWNKSSIS